MLREWCAIAALLLLVPYHARAQDIAATPIPNAPFTAAVSVERTIAGDSGPIIRLKTIHGIGRDTRGRIYNENRALVPATSNIVPALISVSLYDPQTRIATMLLMNSRTYTTQVVRRPPATEPPGLRFGAPPGVPLSPHTQEVDLGTRQMMNISVHGLREIQTIPAEQNSGGKGITVTDEYWYSARLHMNLALRHRDPRIGDVTMVVTQLTLGEPDPARFTIPDGYQPAVPPPAPRRHDDSPPQ